MHADLFANEGGFTPRPAWQVIEAARRQMLTGELSLATTPTTHVYLRDGQVYFAERSTDGGLGVRLLVEGVITRQQIGKGALLVSGVEHLGRMFQRDATIDRQSVELCVELMTDDVLTSMANDVIDHYTMTMYKRHANGIDRWLPTRVEVITHIVDGSHLAEPDMAITPGAGPGQRPDPILAAAGTATAHPEPAPVAAAAPPAAAALPVEPPQVKPEPHVGPEAETPTAVLPVVPVAEVAPARAVAPFLQVPSSSLGQWQPITAEHEVTAAEPYRSPTGQSLGSSLAAAAAAGLLDTDVPLTPAALFEPQPAGTSDSGISLAQSAVDAIMSTAIADEVAEAVRRALAAIDAATQPAPSISPSDFTGAPGIAASHDAATSNA